MIRYCLVCEERHYFNTNLDEDCNRCENCGSLAYTKVDDIVMKHRKEYQEMI